MYICIFFFAALSYRTHSIFESLQNTTVYVYGCRSSISLRNKTMAPYEIISSYRPHLPSSDLTFNARIYAIYSKVLWAFDFLNRNGSEFKNINCLKVLCCSRVRSILEFASIIWNLKQNNLIEKNWKNLMSLFEDDGIQIGSSGRLFGYHSYGIWFKIIGF